MTISKQARIEEIVLEIQRKWGKDAISTLATYAAHPHLTSISTGYSNLDGILHIGGIPIGHLTLLQGKATSGMTTLAYRIVAQAQQAGYVIAYVDCAKTFDGEYAVVRCGVTLDKLLLIHPEPLSQALDITYDLLTLPYRGLVVLHTGISQSPPLPLTTLLERSRITLRRTGWTLLVLLSTNRVSDAALFSNLHLHLERIAWLGDQVLLSGYRTRVSVLKNTFHAGIKSTEIEFVVEE